MPQVLHIFSEELSGQDLDLSGGVVAVPTASLNISLASLHSWWTQKDSIG